MGSVFGGRPAFGVGEFITGVLFGLIAGVGSAIGVNVVFGVGSGLSISTGVGVSSTVAGGVGSGVFEIAELLAAGEFIARFTAFFTFESDAPVGIKKINPNNTKSPITAPEKVASKTPIKVFAPFEAILFFILTA